MGTDNIYNNRNDVRLVCLTSVTQELFYLPIDPSQFKERHGGDEILFYRQNQTMSIEKRASYSVCDISCMSPHQLPCGSKIITIKQKLEIRPQQVMRNS